MNEHEIERIAASMNQLRPDWPVKSLTTLLSRAELRERPRRDVTVALAWVACESGTATPARVLESGPWWRAVSVDGANTHHRDVAAVGTRCTICGRTRGHCNPDHEFCPPHERDVDISQVVAELKGHIAPTREPSAPREAVHTTHGDAARVALHAEEEA